MKKSPVAGISGSIRAVCLTKADLTAAEKHGKRLDATSQARAISKDPPVTTTGLDLQNLYKKHIKDVFVPKCKTIAKHIIIQFPKDLVDGEDPAYMLRHARRIVETIFGDEAIFADRVDRDEQGRHIVDIFVAPKYTKKTKHTSRLAVSVSVHEEALAEKYDRKNTPWGRGQAMQDAIYEYFRDVMKLEGVQRGDPKAGPGPDWKAAEELRKEELEDIKAKLEEERRKIAEMGKNAQQQFDQAKADREDAQKMREEADAANNAAQLEKRRAIEAREIADVLLEDAEALQRQHEAASQKMEEQRISSEAGIARKEARISAELEAAADAKRRASADVAAAAETRRVATALMETAKAEMAKVRTEREQLERDRDREAAQLALLVRAADDGNGLELRVSGATLSMAIARMTQPEKTAYESRWSAGILAIGRKLADALETVRRTLLRLADRESTLERERKEHQRSVAAHQEAQRAHQEAVRAYQDAVRDLDVRIANVNDSERQIKQRLDAATEATNAAAAKERQASAAMLVQEHWMIVIAATASAPDKITVDSSGKVVVAPQLVASIPEPIRSTIQKDAPDWARNIIKERQVLAQARQQAEAIEADWKRKAEAVSADQRRIEKSRKVLDAVASGHWAVAIRDGIMTLRPTNDSDARNVARMPVADLEPSFVRAAQAFTHSVETIDRVLELQDTLKQERSALAKLQPERASQLEEDQRQTDEKVRKGLGLPPELGQGVGM